MPDEFSSKSDGSLEIKGMLEALSKYPPLPLAIFATAVVFVALFIFCHNRRQPQVTRDAIVGRDANVAQRAQNVDEGQIIDRVRFEPGARFVQNRMRR